MVTIDVDFDVFKAITNRRADESVTNNDVLRALLKLGAGGQGGAFCPQGVDVEGRHASARHAAAGRTQGAGAPGRAGWRELQQPLGGSVCDHRIWHQWLALLGGEAPHGHGVAAARETARVMTLAGRKSGHRERSRVHNGRRRFAASSPTTRAALSSCLVRYERRVVGLLRPTMLGAAGSALVHRHETELC